MKKLLKYKQHILVVLVIILSIGLAVGIACGIYYATCRDSALGVAILTMVAAAYGGLLTLGGVAWTIKKGDRDRKEDWERRDKEKSEEERKRVVPYIKFSLGDVATSFVNAALHGKNNEYLQEKTWYCFTIKEFNIKNVSNANILLLGVSLNNKYYEFGYNQLLEKNGTCQIQTTRNWDYVGIEPLNNLELIVSDIIGNQYRISCKFSTEINGVIQEKNEQGEVINTRYESAHTVESVSIPEYIKGA